jgi:YbgC/YbaW family acyl-CoA thioester hydrolase
MNRQTFRFFHPLRVRWAEVDMQKIVFNAHYLMYVDTAVADYWRALGLPYEEAMRQLGGDLYVRKAAVEYHRSAAFDDRLDVALRCARIGNSSMVFESAIFRGDELLVTCELIYVFADVSSQTSRPVPKPLRELLGSFEAGAAMIELQTGSWRELEGESMKLRRAVFVDEQGIPAELMSDTADAGAVHVVGRNRLGQPVATGRLVAREGGVSQIGRVAVHRALRGSGVGLQVLDALVAAACAGGDREVMLHAQQGATGFYWRAGWTARGDYFEEAGIPHLEFFRTL